MSTQQRLYFIEKQIDEENKLLKKITIKQISCGYFHIILLDQNNNIYVHGKNRNGQLGLGHNNNNEDFEQITQFNNKVKLVAAGGYFTIIITLQSEIYGTGLTFIKETTNYFIELPKLEKENLKKVKCGSGFTILMNDKNELFGCGLNYSNQLGTIQDIRSGFKKLDLPNKGKIKDFNCGYIYTTVLMEDGDVYFSGAGGCYSAKIFTKLNFNFNCKQIGALYETLYFLSDFNELYFKEKNQDLIKINFDLKIKRIYSGLGHILYILTENNTIYRINNKNIEKVEEFTLNLPFVSIYPANKFAVVCNSTFNLDEEESREIKRMRSLLFQQINAGFNDASINFIYF